MPVNGNTSQDASANVMEKVKMNGSSLSGKGSLANLCGSPLSCNSGEWRQVIVAGLGKSQLSNEFAMSWREMTQHARLLDKTYPDSPKCRPKDTNQA